MQAYHVRLESHVSETFRCVRAANSLDIDAKKKAVHELKIEADIESPFTVGLILGASGSGKTTLAKSIFKDDIFETRLDPEKPIIEQLPESLSYDECAEILSGIGLTSVPCWIRPVKTLSNGQKARAEAALAMLKNETLSIIDEWTSVVDRTVAKVMSHCVQKFAKRRNKKIILLSCHYDVIEWLDPDWIIDCNSQKFIDRRLLQRKRIEQLEFQIREVGKNTWPYFSKYHYLSENLPGGHILLFGLFHGENQIGFQCFANYTPFRKDRLGMDKMIVHSNRTVIHPDYAGLGLGIRLINQTSEIVANRNYKVMAKFSSVPIYKSMVKNPAWRLCLVKRQIGKVQIGRGMGRKTGFRQNVKVFSFEYVGNEGGNP